MANSQEYYIGVDIGTNSVGYAVTDTAGNLLKFKKQNMWGVNLFDSAIPAQKRRTFRCTRRRYDRRKQRIAYLQEMLLTDISSVDPYFYLRLKQSALWNCDKDSTVADIYSFFNYSDFNEKDYYRKYPTIYHLRKHLMESTEKEDIRLIYLALHHIVKYRGNFLYEDMPDFSAKNSQIKPAVIQLMEAFSDIYEFEYTDDDIAVIVSALSETGVSARSISESIAKKLSEFIDNKKVIKNISTSLVGYKTDFGALFNIESEEKLSTDFSDDAACEKVISHLDDEQIGIFETLERIYSAFLLTRILSGENISSISDAMIEKYNNHKKDLAALKRLCKKYFSQSYNELFRGKKDGNKYIEAASVSYTNYILSSKNCTREDLCKRITDLFSKSQPNISADPDYTYCNNRIENGTFLQLINSTDNGAIPFQLHLEELKSIINKQKQFYPSLLNNEEKLCSLVSFRIPYYVGPLNEKDNLNGQQFAWMKRKDDNSKIFPWNFEEVVDIDESAERFIKRMTNKCTYIPSEDVIPKCSLLYAEFEVRNEIKQIKVDNKFLDLKTQQELYNSLFMAKKTISEAVLRRWLKNDIKYPFSCEKITGFQKENKFASSLTAYIDFTNIFGKVDSSNNDMIETIIEWITLFEDKKILRRKIKNEFPNITDAQLSKIIKLQYSGWSSLSKKLLTEIKAPDKYGKNISIIEFMRCSTKNFMQIAGSDKLPYKKLIEDAGKPEDLSEITPKIINSLAASPAVKRGILQCSAVVKEIVGIMGKEPAKIMIEFAREDGEKKRTASRKKMLSDIYSSLKSNPEFSETVKELADKDDKTLADRMLYLYFLQNGKCMYSGKALNIKAMTKECQIDHIVPQSFVKDDSVSNTVLVYSGYNQSKTNNLIIAPDIQRNMRPIWTSLLRNGLMTQKKFNNLTRELPFSSNDMEKFINRQLVETRQIIKHTANIFSAVYKDSKIIEIKAGLSSDIREQYGLFKSRELNDYHHAHDAYLAIEAGRYVACCYPRLNDEFDYNKFIRNFKKTDFIKDKKWHYGIAVAAFSNIKVDFKTGEVLWNGDDEIERLRKYFGYNDCFISKKTEELTGEFYKQTIQPKSSNSKLIPLKKDLPTERYGGYASPNQAYCVIIEYDGKKKREKKLVGIPIQTAYLYKTEKNAISDYLEKCGYKNVKILKDKILKYQLLLCEGNLYYLSSSSEILNAKQLVVDKHTNEIILKMNKPKLSSTVTDDDLNYAFNALTAKMQDQFTCFGSTTKKLVNGRDAFYKKDHSDKIGIINQILVTLHANAGNGNFENYKLNGLTSREGRMGGKNLDIDKTTFINTSVTGMFSNKFCGKDL